MTFDLLVELFKLMAKYSMTTKVLGFKCKIALKCEIFISSTLSGSLIFLTCGVFFLFFFPGLQILLFSRSCAILSRDLPTI